MKILLLIGICYVGAFGQQLLPALSIESSITYWGVGADLLVIPDTNLAFSVGLVFSQEYGKKELPGVYAWSPPAPHSWWIFQNDHEPVKSFPGVSFGLYILRTFHINAVVDYTHYEKYKVWVSPPSGLTFHTKNGEVSKLGFGAGIHYKIGEHSYIGLMYHEIKGYGLRYTFSAL